MKLLVFAAAYFALLAPALLVFRLASSGPIRRMSSFLVSVRTDGVRSQDEDEGKDEDEPDIDMNTRDIVLNGVLSVILLTVVAYALAWVATRFGFLVQVSFSVIVMTTAWLPVQSLWMALGLDRRVRHPFVALFSWGAITLACGLAWLTTPSWVTNDATFMLLALSAARKMGALSLKTALVTFTLLIAYDVWGVWGSGAIVQLTTAFNDHPLPVMLLVPAHPLSWSADPLVGLGIGDIVVSSMLFAAFARHNLGGFAAAGFAVGLLATLLLPATSVPALLILVPAMALFGALGHLYRRTWQPSPAPVDIAR